MELEQVSFQAAQRGYSGSFEINAITAETEAEGAGRDVRVALERPGAENLEGHGVLHLVVVDGVVCLKEVVVADVHDHEAIANEADAVGAGREGMAADFEWNFGEQIALIFFLTVLE